MIRRADGRGGRYPHLLCRTGFRRAFYGNMNYHGIRFLFKVGGRTAMRQLLLVAVLGGLLSSAGPLTAALNDEIITETTAQRYGLTRMWITQAQVNHGRSRMQSLVLIDGVLYAQSSQATLEAIDAETGQKLWSK